MVLPTFTAGRKLRASELAALVTQLTDDAAWRPIGIVTPPQAARLNTTTLADDPTIAFANLTAGAKYEVFGDIKMRSAPGTDFKIGWSCSGIGATFDWSPGGFGTAGTVTATADDHTALTLSDPYSYGTLSAVATTQVGRPMGTLYVGTGAAISFKFRWAQNVLDAANGTTLMSGSSVTLIRQS